MKDQQSLLKEYEGLKVDKKILMDKHSADKSDHQSRHEELS
jgi:hypothetical protein